MSFKKRLIFIYLPILVLIVLIFFIYFTKISNTACDIQISKKNFKIYSGNFKNTLDDELIKFGLSNQERYKIIDAFGKNINFKTLGIKDEYTLILSTSNNFVSIEIDRGDSIYSVIKRDERYIFERINSKVEVSTSFVKGNIKNILWTSMTELKVPPDVILNYTDMFAWDIDFLTEVRTGDEFGLVYEIKKNHKNKILSRKVLAGYYVGSVTGKKFSVYYKDDYYNEKGESSKSFFLKAPLQYRRISSYFSYKRFHPILKYVRPHLGIDYAAPTGTPVSSVADGVVLYKGWKGGFGNYVEIKHPMGYVTSYGHLSRFATNIYVGKKVKQGDLIGYVGMTGVATGPHLDFRIRHNGSYINYLKLKRSSNKKLPQSDIEEIRKILSVYFPEVKI